MSAIFGDHGQFSTVESLDQAISALGLVLHELPRPALFLASKAFVRYRRQGGTKGNLSEDFLIGGTLPFPATPY